MAWRSRLYNLVQRLTGDRVVQRRIRPYFSGITPRARVIDIGGGTGLNRTQVNGARYICLDIDAQKLQDVPTTHARASAVVGDGAHCPIAPRSVDAVLCAKVVHHLDAHTFALVLAEIGRVLKPGGLVVLADAVRSPRLVPRLLWRVDRGSHPRTAGDLSQTFGCAFTVTATEHFRAGIFHDFVMLTGTTPRDISDGAQAR